MNIELLRTARAIRRMLRESTRYSSATIRDAVTLAADNLRQLHDEANER